MSRAEALGVNIGELQRVLTWSTFMLVSGITQLPVSYFYIVFTHEWFTITSPSLLLNTSDVL